MLNQQKKKDNIKKRLYFFFEKEEIYNQKDAEGFINLFGLPIRVQAKLKGGKHDR